jgi:hypothetical protein
VGVVDVVGLAAADGVTTTDVAGEPVPARAQEKRVALALIGSAVVVASANFSATASEAVNQWS